MNKNYTNQQPNENNQLPHDCLSNYILQDIIGSSSHGKVYWVIDKQTHVTYTTKTSINAIDESLEDLYMNISRKVDIISNHNHPSVRKFIPDSPTNFKQKPKPVIITEYASNDSLSHFI